MLGIVLTLHSWQPAIVENAQCYHKAVGVSLVLSCKGCSLASVQDQPSAGCTLPVGKTHLAYGPPTSGASQLVVKCYEVLTTLHQMAPCCFGTEILGCYAYTTTMN